MILRQVPLRPRLLQGRKNLEVQGRAGCEVKLPGERGSAHHLGEYLWLHESSVCIRVYPRVAACRAACGTSQIAFEDLNIRVTLRTVNYGYWRQWGASYGWLSQVHIDHVWRSPVLCGEAAWRSTRRGFVNRCELGSRNSGVVT